MLVKNYSETWMIYRVQHGKCETSQDWGGIPVVAAFGEDIQLPL